LAWAAPRWFAVEKDEAGRLCVTLADDGRPFDLTTAEVPEREFEECQNKARAVIAALREAEGGLDL
jgi:hypothetical protein